MSIRVAVVGAGQIGTFAAGALERGGGRVLAGDASPAHGFFSRYSGTRDAELVELDVLDRESLIRAFEGHCAEVAVATAGVVGRTCTEDPELGWRVNVDGTLSVAEAALAAGVRRLIFVSSLSVYGRPDTDVIDESHPIAPHSEYGKTKAAAEELLDAFRGQGLEVCVLRPCGVYGPLRLGGGSHSARFIEGILMTAARQPRITVVGGAETREQYLYVRDLAEAIAAVALRRQPLQENVFNVAPGETTTVAGLREALTRLLPGIEVEIRPQERPDRGMPALDATRIRESIGFEPRFSLEEGIAAYAREARLVP